MKQTNAAKLGFYRNIVLVISLILLVLLFALLLDSSNPETLTYDQFIDKVEAGEVEAVYVTTYTATVKYTSAAGSTVTLEQFTSGPTKRCDAKLNIQYRTSLVDQLYAMEAADETGTFKVPTIFMDNPNSGAIWNLLIPILVVVALGVLMFVMYRQSAKSSNNAMNFGKTKARLNQNVKVKFADVAGAEEEKEELREIVDFLKSPRKFIEVGARIPKGVLLVGEPGTGKTLFAKAVAGEANVPFFSISGSDFVEMFVGVGASRVRDLFEQAKANMPCIIFIDEIDAVGRQRGAGLGGGHDEREQTLNQLLVQMDGFETNEGIIIMAATNRADILDPALLRPGRFDRQIYVHVPDIRGREAIFKVHARNKTLAGDIDFRTLARITSGFTGADIENLLNEAAILAARDNRKIILMKDILEGINKVLIGPQKKSRLITESDKRITAYHESGHAILANVLEYCDGVQEVSIIPRGGAAGYTLTRPDNDNTHVQRKKLNDIVCMTLGGRAAEAIVIKDISTGASSDIQHATAIAKSMITEWGMSDKLGNSFWGSSHEVFLGRDFQAQHTYSEETAGKIDEEIKSIIDVGYQRALDTLVKYRAVMDNMVKLLYERETIYADELKDLFKGYSYEECLARINEREAKATPKKAADLIVSEPTTVKEDVSKMKKQKEEAPVESDKKTDEAPAETPKEETIVEQETPVDTPKEETIVEQETPVEKADDDTPPSDSDETK